MSESTLNLKLDADLKKAFEATCKSQNRMPIRVIQELMRAYVKKHSISEMFGRNRN